MKRFLLLGLLVLSVGIAGAESYTQFGTVNVSQDSGDTIATTQVAVGVCPGQTCPTLISPAVTNRGLRRRVIINNSASLVYVGTNTITLATSGFAVSASTGGYQRFDTSSTAAIYGVSGTTSTVTVITETYSAP